MDRRRIWRIRFVVMSVCCLALALLGTRWGDRSLYPATGGDTVPVHFVSNGFHAGLILPLAETRQIGGEAKTSRVNTVAARFGAYDWIEVGWGDEGFYREVPTVAALNWRLGLRALAGLGTGSVVHVVGVRGDPRGTYAAGDLIALSLSRQGYERLLRRLDGSLASDASGQPEALGPGLYGPSLFYRGTGRFFVGQVCNHWIAGLLDAAGVPVSPLLATIPRGLGWDLMWRSGLSHETAGLPVESGTQ